MKRLDTVDGKEPRTIATSIKVQRSDLKTKSIVTQTQCFAAKSENCVLSKDTASGGKEDHSNGKKNAGKRRTLPDKQEEGDKKESNMPPPADSNGKSPNDSKPEKDDSDDDSGDRKPAGPDSSDSGDGGEGRLDEFIKKFLGCDADKYENYLTWSSKRVKDWLIDYGCRKAVSRRVTLRY